MRGIGLVAANGGMSFDYDADGRRVKKTNGTNGTLYLSLIHI